MFLEEHLMIRRILDEVRYVRTRRVLCRWPTLHAPISCVMLLSHQSAPSVYGPLLVDYGINLTQIAAFESQLGL